MRISDWSSDVCSSDLPQVERLADRYADKTHLIGNPVREEVLALRDEDYPTLNEDSVFRLLVTGGSQGATILSSVVPEGLGLLPISLRRRLQVTPQCRVEEIGRASCRERGWQYV